MKLWTDSIMPIALMGTRGLCGKPLEPGINSEHSSCSATGYNFKEVIGQRDHDQVRPQWRTFLSVYPVTGLCIWADIAI